MPAAAEIAFAQRELSRAVILPVNATRPTAVELLRLLADARQAADERNPRPSGSSAEAAAILRRGGVEFSLYPPPGFDGGEIVTWDGIAGRDLQTLAMDAAWAIRGGLDEAVALESITIAPARILGVDHRVGSIEPGKDADLIVTDG